VVRDRLAIPDLNLGTIERTVAIDNQALATHGPFNTLLEVAITRQSPPLVPLIAWAPHLGFGTVLVRVRVDDNAKVWVHAQFQVVMLLPR
jgi:hypothetical protein